MAGSNYQPRGECLPSPASSLSRLSKGRSTRRALATSSSCSAVDKPCRQGKAEPWNAASPGTRREVAGAGDARVRWHGKVHDERLHAALLVVLTLSWSGNSFLRKYTQNSSIGHWSSWRLPTCSGDSGSAELHDACSAPWHARAPRRLRTAERGPATEPVVARGMEPKVGGTGGQQRKQPPGGGGPLPVRRGHHRRRGGYLEEH